MKLRLSVPVAARGALPAVGRWAAGAVLLAATVSACTGGGSTVPSIFTPTSRPPAASTAHPPTRTPSPTSGRASATGRPTATSSPSPGRTTTVTASAPVAPAPTLTPTHTPSHSPAATPSPVTSTVPPVTHTPVYPTAAPQTGGGGTAGLQDGLLFGIGGAAVLAGIGSLALRRRLARRFNDGRSAPRDPADRERADR